MTTRSVGPHIDGLSFIEHLGSGGFSDVYLYEQRRPKMRVAVKVLTGEGLTPAQLEQFADEAETMAELADHPNIVQVFSAGTADDGRPYLVMKYYPPPNLGARAGRERFSVAEVLRTGIQLASAVETAHRAGILHRDIKPANVLVNPYGEPGLADFGIASRGVETDGGDDLSVSIPWSPPEVLSGDSNGSVASDVYSLAATLWHLLAGRSPFEVPGGDNSPRALMGRILRNLPPVTGRGDVPPSLDRLLQQSMSKQPTTRPVSALAFARSFQAIEQELRYARTELMLDGGAIARPVHVEPAANPDVEVSGARAAAWAPDRGSDDVRTSMRPVRPAPTSPPGAPATTTRPVRAPASTPAGAPPTTARSVPPATEPPTTARPVRAGAAGTLAPKTPGTGTETQRRPERSEPVPSALARERGVSVRAAIAIGVLVVAAAVVAAVVVISAASRGTTTGATTPPGPTANDVLGTDGGLAPPEVTHSYNVSKHALTFRWRESGGGDSPVFVYQLSTDHRPVRTTGSSVTVPATDPASVCIDVSVLTASGTQIRADPDCG